jgi:hypothetical protein
LEDSKASHDAGDTRERCPAVSGVFVANADVQDQLTVINRPKVVNHRIAGQRCNRGSRKVSQLSHEKYVREIVDVELFIDVFGRRQS